MPHNATRPQICVEPGTFGVWIDGEPISPAPDGLPLAQRYADSSARCA